MALRALAAIVAALAVAPPAHAVLSIGVGTPPAPMDLAPGTTGSTTGTLLVTPGVGTWSVSVRDAANGGHLKPAAAGCAGAESQTVNSLTARAQGALGTTSSAGTKTVGTSAQAIATGTLADTLTVTYGLAILTSERMPAGCVFSTTLTFTVQ